jgi:peptidyl-prolyl cis-trans isomerase B (cyclophilin B)
MKNFAALALLIPAAAGAQLSVGRLYYGVDRPLRVSVAAAGTLQWIDSDGRSVLQTGRVRKGEVDLATLWPDFWREKSKAVRYLQWVGPRGAEGPALVFQPLVSPTLSRLASDGKTIEFVPDEDQAFSGFRVYADRLLRLETTLGNLTFRLRPDAAPNTVFTIRQLVEGGFYTDILWHRVVAKRPDGSPFVVQGGDPSGTGSGGPGFAYALERSSLPHDFGVLSIARSTDPNTNGSQLFVGLSRAGTQHLDGRYASFGQLVEGAETLLKLAAVPVGAQDRPVQPPRITRARLVPAPPITKSPRPLTRPEG